jgi:PAS domain S-box-containing protein
MMTIRHVASRVRRFVLLFALVVSVSAAQSAEKVLTLGVYVYRSAAEMEQRFTPLVRYLSEHLEGYRIELRVLSPKEMEEALERGELDLVLTNPVHYIELREKFQMTGAITTVVSLEEGVPVNRLGGVIFARKDSGFNGTLEQVKQKRFAIFGRHSLGAFLAPQYEFYKAGINLVKHGKLIDISTSHDDVVHAVMNKEADVGFVRSGVLESMARKGEIDLAEVFIINEQHYKGFGYRVSTQLYPEWPFVALPHVQGDVKRGIITFVNDKFCEISGYSLTELIGKPHSIVRHPDMPKEAFEELWQTILSGQVWEGVVKNRKKDGSHYWVQTVINPIIDIEGNIVEYMAIRHEVTKIITLHEEIEKTQQEIIYRMGEIGESRSKETGNHVRRVAEYLKLLAFKAGLDEKEAKLIADASPMHDIGKVAIPDSVLHKPGLLNDDEWLVMRSHSSIGHKVLSGSGRPLLNAASVIAHEHHEKYSGGGYPSGLVGEDIHIYARIVAIADVFDALGSDRVYKKAWPLDKIITLFKEEKGKHFDPKLVDLFLGNLEEFLVIRDQYSDYA